MSPRARLASRHARRRGLLVLPTPLSPETANAPATIWSDFGCFHTGSPESVQEIAARKVAYWDKNPVGNEFEDYDIFTKPKRVR
jgi:hypothetical protein